MKRIGLISLFAVLILLVSATLILRRTRAVDIAVNVRDLPEYGVRLVAASDPQFDGLAAAKLKNISPDSIESNKPFSVFVKNTGKRDLVAYVLKWELVEADGSVRTHVSSDGNPNLLMGSAATSNPALMESSPVVKPSGAKFCSWVEPDPGQGLGSTSASTPAGSSDSGFLERAAKGGNKDGIRDYLQTQLRQGRSITISVDGAFFDDGTFVGPNTTGYYERIEAQVRAKRDLLEEMNKAAGQGKKADEVFQVLDQYRSLPQSSLGGEPTPSEVYDFWKKTYADEAHRRKGAGAQPVLDSLISQYRKAWPGLKKQK